jgi:hypothetical protein
MRCAGFSAEAHRLRECYGHLVKAYGPQKWWPAKTPFEVVIGAYCRKVAMCEGCPLAWDLPDSASNANASKQGRRATAT